MCFKIASTSCFRTSTSHKFGQRTNRLWIRGRPAQASESKETPHQSVKPKLYSDVVRMAIEQIPSKLTYSPRRLSVIDHQITVSPTLSEEPRKNKITASQSANK